MMHKIKAFFIISISILSLYIALPTISPHTASLIPESVRPNPLNLGLDLRGGASILMEVDINSYLEEFYQKSLNEIVQKLKSNGVHYQEVQSDAYGISIFCDEDIQNQSKNVLNTATEIIGGNIDHHIEGNVLKISMNQSSIAALQDKLVAQSIKIINRRIDESGMKEIDIQQQGSNYISIQVPGFDNPDEIKKLIGKTAKLSFHIVEDNVTIENLYKSKIRTKLRPLELEKEKKYLIVYSNPIMTGEMLTDAQVKFDNMGQPVISFVLNKLGSRIFADTSSKNIGKAIAIVLDDKIISAPVIRQAITGGDGVISGNFSVQSANELALLLRAGSLPTQLKIIEERTVGPSLGIDSINSGVKAVLIGTIMVMVSMILFYGIFGFVANIALLVNLFMIIALLSLFGASLTLPGIAGIVLTLGMAVDANVLICERIKEELRNGKSNWHAIQNGYKIAITTILDANITTVIASLILYMMGSGSIKSFAISLMIGIICSMLTTISLTKIITNYWYSITIPKKLYI